MLDLYPNLNFVKRSYKEKMSFSKALREGARKGPGGIQDTKRVIRRVTSMAGDQGHFLNS